MPAVTAVDAVHLHVSTLKKADIAAYQAKGRHPFPVADLMRQVVSDRFTLAGQHLTAGDQLVLDRHFRSAISRHYYAMYQAARAVVFAVEQGDDFERHHILPRHLPQGLSNVTRLEAELTDARLLRNQADYDCYPVGNVDWESDARGLASVAASFVLSCEDFALANGFV